MLPHDFTFIKEKRKLHIADIYFICLISMYMISSYFSHVIIYRLLDSSKICIESLFGYCFSGYYIKRFLIMFEGKLGAFKNF
jgi:hypothetical protein